MAENVFERILKRDTEQEPMRSAFGEEARESSNVRSLIAGATPLLAGILGGNIKDAYAPAAEALGAEDTRMLKAQETERKSLMDLMKAQKKAAMPSSLKRRFQMVAVENPETGKIENVKFDTFTGETADTEKLRGYRKGVIKDPTTGELVTTSGALGTAAPTVIAGQKKVPFTVKEEKDLRTVQSNFLKDPDVKKSKTTIAASGRAIELLKSANPVSDEGIKVIFPRMFGEVGNLAVQEQERFSGSPELRRRFLRLKSRWTEGSLTDEDRSDLLEVAQVMGAYDQRRLKELAGTYIGSEAALTGMTKEQIAPVIEGFTKIDLPKGKIARQVKKDLSVRLTGKDKAAYEWAKRNSKDPRAKQIIERLRK